MLLTVQCCWILHASDGIRGCYSQTKHEMPHMEMHSKVWPNIPEDVIQHGSLWAVYFHIERDRWCYLCFLISPFSLSLSGSSCFGGPSSYGADEQPDQSIYLCHLKCWKNMNFEVSKRWKYHPLFAYIKLSNISYFLLGTHLELSSTKNPCSKSLYFYK